MGDNLAQFINYKDFVTWSQERRGLDDHVANYTSAHNWDPSNFCVFGIEGNPIHTPRLQSIEADLSRKVHHLKIFTETVVNNFDGSAAFFIDNSSADHNFWGSSVLSNHPDVVKSGQASIQVTSIDFARLINDMSKETRAHGGVLVVKVRSRALSSKTRVAPTQLESAL